MTTVTQLAFLDVPDLVLPDPVPAPRATRFSPPGGKCAPSCPYWRACRAQQCSDPLAPVACEVDDEAAGIDPIARPEGVGGWDMKPRGV